MTDWRPITLNELDNQIKQGENLLTDELLKFWNSIKVTPKKWSEKEYGKEGGGFWVVAIFRNQVIWYNDIEEGFNISKYKSVGHIDEYYSNQDELNLAIDQLFKMNRQKDNNGD